MYVTPRDLLVKFPSGSFRRKPAKYQVPRHSEQLSAGTPKFGYFERHLHQVRVFTDVCVDRSFHHDFWKPSEVRCSNFCAVGSDICEYHLGSM